MAPKAVFVEFELDVRHPNSSIKPKYGKRAVNDAWAALGPAARRSVADKITKARNATARVEEQTNIAVAAGNAFPTQVDDPTDFWDEFNATVDEFRFLLTLHKRCEDAWQALRKEYEEQGLSNEVRNYITNKMTAAATTAWIYARLERTVDVKDRRFPVEPDDNNAMKMRKKHLSRRRRESARKAKAQTDATAGWSGMRDLAGQPGSWVPWKRIGRGGFGTAWIWIYFDQNNVIRRRVVRKDTHWANEWYNIKSWTGNDLKDYNSRRPWEHQCQSQLTYVADASHVVHMTVPWSPLLVSPGWKTHRIYTEWCPLGDLDALIKKYRGRPAPNNHIPEPMIWAAAEALALAGLAMQYGHESPTAPMRAGWRPIIHRDLKPANVFLALRDPNATLYPFYPKPVLSDFGLAIETSPTDPHNPSWYLEAGTPGFQAPEQLSYIDRDTLLPLNPTPLTDKTNVFGIGTILYSLLTLRDIDQPDFLGPNPQQSNPYTLQDDNGDEYPHQTHADQYTPALRSLIDDCTQHDPGSRPDFRTMLTRIRNLNDGPDDRPPAGATAQDYENTAEIFGTRGMRGGWANATTRAEYCLKNADGTEWTKGDEYVVGLHRDALQLAVPRAV